MRRGLTVASRRIFRFLLFALVVQVFVLPQLGGAREALHVVSSVNPWRLVVALALYASSLVVYAILTQHLIPEDERPPLSIVMGSVLASTGVNHVVPGGAATTAAVNYRLLGRAGVKNDVLQFALGTQAIGSAVVLNVILWIALVISIPTSGFHPIYASAAAVGACLISLFGLAVLSIRNGHADFADRISGWAARLPRVSAEPIRRELLGVAKHVDVLSRDHERLKIVAGLAAANWLLDAAALWVALSAFGPMPNVVGVLVAYGLANVMAAIPISPGGLGVIEAILIPTLVGFGVEATEASVGVVAYRLVSFWLPIPVGAISYFLVERATSIGNRIGFRGEVNEASSH